MTRRLSSADADKALGQLREATDHCRECPLGERATQSVCGEGPPHPKIMVVGEQPGDREDLGGRPFIGPAGKLLDRALEELGWARKDLYITNAVKHFKYELRGKRRMHKTPGQREIEACHHWLDSEIEILRPTSFIALGATAAIALLGRRVPVLKERGHWIEGPAGRPVLITLHPSALLRGDPDQREVAWQAWLQDLRVALPPR